MIAATLRTAALPALRRCAAASTAASRPAAAASFHSSAYHLARRYTKEHEWADLDKGSDIATVGITKHAANQLGDVVFVEISDKGTTVEEGQTLGTIESVKAVSDLYAPLSGTIEQHNEAVVGDPEKINSAPESDGWIVKLKLSKPAEFEDLLTEEAYQAFLKSSD